jgi:hypothetical protein
MMKYQKQFLKYSQRMITVNRFVGVGCLTRIVQDSAVFRNARTSLRSASRSGS